MKAVVTHPEVRRRQTIITRAVLALSAIDLPRLEEFGRRMARWQRAEARLPRPDWPKPRLHRGK